MSHLIGKIFLVNMSFTIPFHSRSVDMELKRGYKIKCVMNGIEAFNKKGVMFDTASYIDIAISRVFIKVNSEPKEGKKKLFTDITDSYNRNEKLENLLR